MIKDFLICLLTLPDVLNHLFPGIVARDMLRAEIDLTGFLPAPLSPVVHHPAGGAICVPDLPVVGVVVLCGL